jgi:hypothetical protein
VTIPPRIRLSPALIIEVAQSGLPVARGRKAAAYARVLEVHREAARTGPARRRWGYGAIEALGADATVTPLAAPAATMRVADLLPQPPIRSKGRQYRRYAIPRNVGISPGSLKRKTGWTSVGHADGAVAPVAA